MKKFFFLLYAISVSVIMCSCRIRDKQITATAVPDPVDVLYNSQILEAESLLKEGDLVLRNGNEFSSQLFKNFSKTDKTYSHAGLAFFENGYPFIYHIVTGDLNPEETVRKDSLKTFCNPRKTSGFALYRYEMDPVQVARLKNIILEWYKKEIRFDSLFSLETDDKMYCSEMIRKALEVATDGSIKLNITQPTKNEAEYYTSYFKLPAASIMRMNFVAIDNLFIHPSCRVVKRFDFSYQPLPLEKK